MTRNNGENITIATLGIQIVVRHKNKVSQMICEKTKCLSFKTKLKDRHRTIGRQKPVNPLLLRVGRGLDSLSVKRS